MAKLKNVSMATVKLAVSMAGSGFTWEPGQVVAVPADDAERMIAAGYATKVGKSKTEPESEPEPPAE